MNDPAKKITRETLYEEVWRTPMSKLAVAWNTSTARIIKACEEMNVPRPDPSYWSLIRRGWQVDREQLLPVGPIVPTESPISQGFSRPAPKKRPVETPTKSANPPGDLKSLHPLVAAF